MFWKKVRMRTASNSRTVRKTLRGIVSKALALVAAVAFALPMLPATLATADEPVDAAARSVTNGVYDRIADTSTAMNFRNILGTTADGGRYTGRLWTDKSVFTGNFISQTNPSYTVVNDSDFLVSFSALGSTRVINGQSTVPIDLVLMLDVSTSMSIDGTAGQGRGPIVNLTSEANKLIEQLMNMNSQNRVGVVVYSGGAQTLMDLSHYEKRNNAQYLTLQQRTGAQLVTGASNTHNFNSMTANAVKVDASGNRTNYSKTSSYMLADSTYLQGALYEGMNMLATVSDTTYTDANGTTGTRIPAVVVLTDGGTNVMTKSTSASASANNWWNPITGRMPTYASSGNGGCWPQVNGDPVYVGLSNSANNSFIAPRTVATLMTGGYMKKAIEGHYGTDMRGYGIGLNVSGLGANEKTQLNATMNPKQYFVSGGGGSAEISTAYNAFTQYLSGATPALNYSGTFLNNFSGTYYIKHPSAGIADFNSVNELYYIDQYYDANDSTLGDIFDNIYSQLGGLAFHPISGSEEDGLDDAQAGVTFTDPLGQYMDLKEFKTVRIFGKNYNLRKTTSGTTETWAVLDGTNADVRVQNTSYINPTYFNLNEISITVNKSDKFNQVVTINVPEAAIPLQKETIDLGPPDANGNQEVLGYSSTNGEQDPSSYPIRFFYTVGIHDDVKSADGTVDLGKLSNDYKYGYSVSDPSDPTAMPMMVQGHMNPDGSVDFLSNLFTGLHTASNVGATSGTAGDANVSFYPSKTNRFYYFQENRTVYASASGGDANHEGVLGNGANGTASVSNPVTNMSQITGNLNGTFYIVVDYYRPTSSGKGEFVQYVLHRSGNELTMNNSELDSAVTYYNTQSKQEVSAPGANVVVATKVGGARLGDLRSFPSEKLGTNGSVDTGNQTHTATLNFDPSYSNETSTQMLVATLGNNGRETVSATSLRVSKRMDEIPEGLTYDKEKEYTFNVVIAGLNGDQIVRVHEYDPDTGEWEYTGESLTVPFTNGSATITLKENQAYQFDGLSSGLAYTVTEDKDASGLEDDQSTEGYSLLHATGVGSTQGASKYVLQGTTTSGQVCTADFVNTYTTTVTNNYALPITKIMEGRDFDPSDSFTFVMRPAATGQAGATTPMPNGQLGGEYKLTLGPNLTGTALDPEPDDPADAPTRYEANQKLVFIGDGSSTANSITYTKPGDYVYLISEERPSADDSIPGISYDDSVYRLTVKAVVKVDGSGLDALPVQLERRDPTQTGAEYEIIWTSRDVWESFGLSFTNTYSTSEVERIFQGMKIVDGYTDPTRSMNGVFGFTLTAQGSYDIEDAAVYDYLSDGSGNSAEQKLDYINNLPAGSWADDNEQPMPGNGEEGYVFSPTIVAYTGEEGFVQFAPTVFKTVGTGDDIKLRGMIYRYTLRENQPTSDGTMDGTPLDGAVKNADGNWVYKGIVYNKDVQTFYVWSHLDPVSEGSTDTIIHTVMFGNMPFDTSAGAGHSAIQNLYRSQTSLPLTAQKQIEGRDFIAGDSFSFQIVGSVRSGNANATIPMPSGVTISATNPASGTVAISPSSSNSASIDFGSIPFTQADAGNTYRYTLSELSTSLPGVQYSPEQCVIDVTVTDDGDGNLTATVTKAGQTASTTPVFTWTNTYAAAPVSPVLTGIKRLENRRLTSTMFSFTVTQTDETGTPIAGGQSYTSTNIAGSMGADGVASAPFLVLNPALITYTNPGTYYYLVTENVSDPIENIVYDTHQYLLTVPVTDNNLGNLIVGTISMSVRDGASGAWTDAGDDTVTFTNEYTGTTFEVMSVKKEVTGKAPGTEAGKYSFVMNVTDGDGNPIADGYILPDNREATNAADGSVSFDSIKFNKQGTYRVNVIEKQPTDDGTFEGNPLPGAHKINVNGVDKWHYNGVTYDPHVAYSIIEVSEAGDGRLVADVMQAPTARVFSNDAGITVSKRLAGSLDPGDENEEFAFSLSAWTAPEEGETANNPIVGFYPLELKDANGNVTSTSIEFDSDGNASFTLTGGSTAQILGLPSGTQYTVKEVLTNDQVDDDWHLVLPAEGEESGTIAPDVVAEHAFLNHKGEPGTTKATVTGTKTITLDDPTADYQLEAGAFSFTVTPYPANPAGDPVKTTTVANDADGLITFLDGVVFTQAGTYRYEVCEAYDAQTSNIIFDEAVYTIVVDVESIGNGLLANSVSFLRNGEPFQATGNGLVFDNTYKDKIVSVMLQGDKTLTGKLLEGDDFKFMLKPLAASVRSAQAEAIAQSEEEASLQKEPEQAVIAPASEDMEESEAAEEDVTETHMETDAEEDEDATSEKDTTSKSSSASTSRSSSSSSSSTATERASSESESSTADAPLAQADVADVIELVPLEIDDIPMPSNATGTGSERHALASNTPVGMFRFGQIVYDAPGVYTYSISEVNDGQEHTTYDETSYIVEVTVTEDENGELKASTRIVEPAGATSIAFENEYTGPPTPDDEPPSDEPGTTPEAPGGSSAPGHRDESGLVSETGDLTQRGLNATYAVGSIAACGAIVLELLRRRRKPQRPNRS